MFKIGLDLGYGYVKGVNEAGKGVVFPSLVSAAYDRPLSALFGGQKENPISNMHLVITNGDKEEYFVGELARREGHNVSYAFDEDKINHPSTKALLAAASILLFPEEGTPVHLVTGLPLEQFVNQKAEFEDMLKNFKIIASFKGDQKVKIIKFARVTVFPQAAGAVYGAILDNIQKYLIPGSYIGLIDVGFKTTDFIAFIAEDKLVIREDLSGTINVGMAAVNSAADKLFTQKTGSKLDIPELMRLINTGKIFYKGRELDFSRELATVKAEISRVIKDRIKSAWGSKMDFFNTVFLAGGGAKELQVGLSDIYEKTILVEDPQFANARGFLKVAAIEERKVAAS
ncbi:StbA family protein [Thermoanaerobacterium sp. DL9XJH110]|uniref:ParM/StbA family protein n=1 Tax=Thermoanaerobacterium sp. DL9XJH110 TaxID=3386643 RepID=UPI003BB63FDC